MKKSKGTSIHLIDKPRESNHPTTKQMRELFNTEFQSLKAEVAATLVEVRDIMQSYHLIARALTRIEAYQRETKPESKPNEPAR